MSATLQPATVTPRTPPRARPETGPQRPRPGVTRAGIFGIGAALPDQVVTNADIEARLDTSDEWIVRRTGIRERRHLAPGEPLAPLAAEACLAALRDAGRDPEEVDRLIVTTITPDLLTPGLAPAVATAIGAHRASAIDENAACAGFLFALDQASALVESGRAEVVLVCSAEALSRILDHEDRSTAVLFGDGAAAAVVAGGDLDMGFGPFVLGSDGAHAQLLYATVEERLLRMEGREVYRHAVKRMSEATAEALARAGCTVEDIDLFVAHQANSRIIESAAAELGVPRERVVMNVDRFANTSSVSIPLALWQAEREGVLRPDMTVALATFGAGFVWGAGVVRWKERVHVCA
jgi:3-oxoacyl-[acyl-carrier-protein] synthase III